MARGINWERHNRGRVTPDDVAAARDERVLVGKAVLGARNKLDVERIEELLRLPELTEYEREKLYASLAWLREISTRTLSFAWRRFFSQIERACHARRVGTAGSAPDAVKEAWAARAKRKRQLRAIRTDETKPSQPAWMRDPTLLPKKPPGR